MILTTTQAQAAYNAMAELNNVGAALTAFVGSAEVDTRDGVRVVLRDKPNGLRCFDVENYADQAAFAAAYGLK